MIPRQVGITVDCADAAQLASFWERFLGYTRRPGNPGSPYVTIERGNDGPDGPPILTFQTVPEPKRAKARLHLDLFVDHARPLVDEMSAAGASTVSRTEAGEWTTRVLQDPAGNEFCVIGPDRSDGPFERGPTFFVSRDVVAVQRSTSRLTARARWRSRTSPGSA